MSLPENRKAAIALAELGLRIVPIHGVADGVCTCPKQGDCPSPGKHPRVTGWQTEATHDPEAVANWFKVWPASNVGVAMGPAVDGSKPVCDIEFDDAEGEATAAEHLEGIETPTWRSGRGVHRLFQLPEKLPASAVVKARGLEIRLGTDSKGAQSVVPPSPHHNGEARRWCDGLSPWQVDLAPFPDAVLGLLGGEKAASGDVLTMSHAMPFAEHPGAKEGERRDVLCKLIGFHLAKNGPDADLAPSALAWAKRCTPELPDAEVVAVVSDLTNRHQAEPKAKAKPKGKLIARRFDSIEPKPVEWLWPGRIPLGKLTLLTGDPGLGKTFLACDLAARISTGEAFPDGSLPQRGEVAIVTAEDGADDTLRPRLDAHGADPSKVHCIEGVRQGEGEAFLNLSAHLDSLGDWFAELPELRLIIIDPISAFLGGTDSHNNADVRAALGPLSKLAEEYGVAVVAITHLSKREGSSLHRITGSIAFVAAARVAWRLGADPDDPERRLLLCVKNNLAQANGLAFRLVDGRLEWEPGEVLVTADELDSEDDTPREEAERWLLGKLTDGPAKAASILKAARADGVSERTLRRAKRALEVPSDRVGGEWLWSLPDPKPTPADDTAEANTGLYVVG